MPEVVQILDPIFSTGGYEILFTFLPSSPGRVVAIKCDSAFTEADKELSDMSGTIEFVAKDTGFE